MIKLARLLPLWRLGALLVASAVGATALPAIAQAALHGADIHKVCVGPAVCDPNEQGVARVGDTITCTIEVSNADTFGHSIRVDSITDSVMHDGGATTTGNLLGAPVTLPALGTFVDVTHTDVVAASDTSPLADTASTTGVDLGQSSPGNDFSMSIGATVTVVQCCADSDCPGDSCAVGACVSNVCTKTPKASGTECRASAGVCDPHEVCDGTQLTCPPNTLTPGSVVCRPSMGDCDPSENCTGSTADCPPDLKSGTVCRAAAGPCDVAESCDGTTNVCPPNSFTPPSTTCRAAAGDCDVAENCSGTSAACPPDLKKSGTTCRASAGVCDVAELCDGTSDTCPPDSFLPNSTTCRFSGGDCDDPEFCSGTSANCPPDAKKAAGTTCRGSAGACDVAEVCDGTSNTCPPDALASSSTNCRTAAGDCDVPENCTGSSATCPADAKKAAGTTCRMSAGVCDVAEVCDGTSATCPPDGFAAASTSCRAASGECDVAEKCTGSIADCPPDAKKANGTSCMADGLTCTQDICDGTSMTCQHPAGNAGAVCRSAAGQCDIPETCSGSDGTCPANAFQPAGTSCDLDNNPCTIDQCNGSGTCVFKNASNDPACGTCGNNIQANMAPCQVKVSTIPNTTFTNLQTAINTAPNGATIDVQGVCFGPILITSRSNLTIQGVPPTPQGCTANGGQPLNLTSTIRQLGGAELYKVVSSTNITTRFLNFDGANLGFDGIEYKKNPSGTVHCNCVAFNDEGINLDAGSSNVVTQNLTTKNTGQGIIVENSAKLHTISGNFSIANAHDGIRIKTLATQNLFTSNDVLNNGMIGINLDAVSSNSVTLNRVMGNGTVPATDGGIIVQNASKSNVIDQNLISGNVDGLTNVIRCFSGSMNTGSNVTPACQ